eukprot:CAMPEP_0194370694 /NCGR_PEP_ID=MMETSP0174-20130528/19030_1 /TAXON_ID=216777 /ORGANISM="Proboscia alata, Strain PI-D3" /LENGTH=613 /DNA_ID=CAMNT_0039148313 /DNA_START=103 /DNA_END=1944 /DNA_ORIENTATION=-
MFSIAALSTSIRTLPVIRICNNVRSTGHGGRRIALVSTSTLKYDIYSNTSSFLSNKFFSTTNKEQSITSKTPVPVTLLAGFLGSGKTSCLTNLLSNNEGYKVGVIVNDVASVNIDAKLILANRMNTDSDSSRSSQRENDPTGAALLKEGETIELQNGCACCSLADELLESMDTLLDGGKREFDAVVVELSGIADPMVVKKNWMDATAMGHPATALADINRVVTVIDSSTFGTDWMTWDTAGVRDGWVEEGDDCAAQRKVPELLAEQVEAADTLLINKTDLAGAVQVSVAAGLATQLNTSAELFETVHGNIPIANILGSSVAATSTLKEEQEEGKTRKDESTHSVFTHGHDHSHSHAHASSEQGTSSPTCSDSGCGDTSHSHPHEEESSSCADPGCTDTSHSHSHSHASSTASINLGISSFVYKRSLPFHSSKLLSILNQWPVPIKEELNLDSMEEDVQQTDKREKKDGTEMLQGSSTSPFVGVLRSKGFCWLAPTQWSEEGGGDSWRHDTAMYWSHAGKHFGITTAGKWWGSTTKENMKEIFSNNQKEYERILAEDWISDEFGDRRQELVFIGAQLNQEEIERELDSCLIRDGGEMEEYRRQLKEKMDNRILQ